MAVEKKSILLFNPWIYDFAAYDFWFKPIGLLTIGAVLRRLGYNIHLVDCLDRFHPELINYLGRKPESRSDYSGKFHRDSIEKPDVLQHIPRQFSRYGMPIDFVSQLLAAMEPPDVVLVTSFMTYWYVGVKDAIELLRRVFPKTKIILGGIYATLCSQHAHKILAPDFIIQGEG